MTKRTLLLSAIISLLYALPLSADDSDAFAHTFHEVYPVLDETLELVDKHRELPESSWFSSDQESNNEDIDELLEDAVAALDLDSTVAFRDAMKLNRTRMKSAQQKIAEYRRLRFKAPVEATFGLETLPYFITKKGYDQKIEEEQDHIEQYKESIESLKREFRAEINQLGLSIPADEFDFLLETVTGDDYLSMQLSFKAIASITRKLEQLTEESGEDVETARRYYGMYVVLLKVLDKTQKLFIQDIDDVHIPKIARLVEVARDNITEAQRAIANGGDVHILAKNVESNEVTIEALKLYRQFLDEQKEAVIKLNESLKSDLITATNTYHTVSLASEVTSLLRSGAKRFEGVKSLEVPHMLEFENRAVRNEFMKLTQKLRVD